MWIYIIIQQCLRIFLCAIKQSFKLKYNTLQLSTIITYKFYYTMKTDCSLCLYFNWWKIIVIIIRPSNNSHLTHQWFKNMFFHYTISLVFKLFMFDGSIKDFVAPQTWRVKHTWSHTKKGGGGSKIVVWINAQNSHFSRVIEATGDRGRSAWAEQAERSTF